MNCGCDPEKSQTRLEEVEEEKGAWESVTLVGNIAMQLERRSYS